MKIEVLNIWGGTLLDLLINHIKRQANEIDIFCFQEVLKGYSGNRLTYEKATVDIFNQIEEILPNHVGYFAPIQNNQEGLGMFIRKTIPITIQSDIFVYRWKDAMENNDARTLGRNLQYVQFMRNGEQITVGNFHGLWNGKDKIDSSDRIEQSNKIRQFLDKQKGKKILCGDFNLLPGTESLKILEKGMRNLIVEYSVKSTRSSLYKKSERLADYVLVSPDVKVIDFYVLPDEVSDHLALVVEVDI